MTPLSYVDFDLQIQQERDGYRATVLTSPAGQASVDFQMPFSDLELENFFLRVGRTRRGTRSVGSPEMRAAQTFGSRLFDTVFGGEVRACFRSSFDQASQQGKGLRIRLRIKDVPGLLDLPWEYLYHSSLNRFLSLSNETPLVRYLDMPEFIRPLKVKPPLKVLVMISSPTDYVQLDVEREWAALNEALANLQEAGLITLERLESATLTALQRRLRLGDCHIFHFIGHGAFDQPTQDGVLILEGEEQRGRLISGHYLGTLLHDHRPLRLAVLNACEGGRTSRLDPFSGVAQSLVQQGIPAVIAMQFEVTDEAAITLAHEFYAAIADGLPIDGALAEARKAVFAHGNDVEWGTPVLYLRSPDGRIFSLERNKPVLPPQFQAASHTADHQATEKRDSVTARPDISAVGRAPNTRATSSNARPKPVGSSPPPIPPPPLPPAEDCSLVVAHFFFRPRTDAAPGSLSIWLNGNHLQTRPLQQGIDLAVPSSVGDHKVEMKLKCLGLCFSEKFYFKLVEAGHYRVHLDHNSVTTRLTCLVKKFTPEN
jgi:hypothetical protein